MLVLLRRIQICFVQNMRGDPGRDPRLRQHPQFTGSANQMHAGFRLGIQAATPAGVLIAIAYVPRRRRKPILKSSNQVGDTIVPRDGKARACQVLHSPSELATANDVVQHMLPDDRAAGLTGRGWMQAYGDHLRRPLMIVVAAPRRLPKVPLPQVAHLMDERLQNSRHVPTLEVDRIHRDLVGRRTRLVIGAKSSPIVVAEDVCTSPLEGDQTWRQCSAKERRVEMVVRFLQFCVCLSGGSPILAQQLTVFAHRGSRDGKVISLGYVLGEFSHRRSLYFFRHDDYSISRNYGTDDIRANSTELASISYLPLVCRRDGKTTLNDGNYRPF